MILQFIVISILTFFIMEGTAWFTHKYVMHGMLWNWHKSHHTHHKNKLEKNDLFALFFSVFTILLILVGVELPKFSFLIPVGVGIALYGLFYFIFHDIIVHRRIKVRIKAKHPYLQRIMNAHYIHHKVHSKEGAEAFGFLYAPKKYGKQEKPKKEEVSS